MRMLFYCSSLVIYMGVLYGAHSLHHSQLLSSDIKNYSLSYTLSLLPHSLDPTDSSYVQDLHKLLHLTFQEEDKERRYVKDWGWYRECYLKTVCANSYVPSSFLKLHITGYKNRESPHIQRRKVLKWLYVLQDHQSIAVQERNARMMVQLAAVVLMNRSVLRVSKYTSYDFWRSYKENTLLNSRVLERYCAQCFTQCVELYFSTIARRNSQYKSMSNSEYFFNDMLLDSQHFNNWDICKKFLNKSIRIRDSLDWMSWDIGNFKERNIHTLYTFFETLLYYTWIINKIPSSHEKYYLKSNNSLVEPAHSSLKDAIHMVLYKWKKEALTFYNAIACPTTSVLTLNNPRHITQALHQEYNNKLLLFHLLPKELYEEIIKYVVPPTYSAIIDGYRMGRFHLYSEKITYKEMIEVFQQIKKVYFEALQKEVNNLKSKLRQVEQEHVALNKVRKEYKLGKTPSITEFIYDCWGVLIIEVVLRRIISMLLAEGCYIENSNYADISFTLLSVCIGNIIRGIVNIGKYRALQKQYDRVDKQYRALQNSLIFAQQPRELCNENVAFI